MMPLLLKLLSSSYCDYLLIALQALDAVLIFAEADLKQAAQAPTDVAAMRSMSVQGIYLQLAQLQAQVEVLVQCELASVAKEANGVLARLVALD
jgi:hypothetical protein